ncbi:MAG: recD [Chlamydiales bacterium]|jgi:exodeoxyribonuclease V alpha subunit|nr:recD [Chlamydiales bacterium]
MKKERLKPLLQTTLTPYLSMDQIFGYIERITFQNIDNGYTVAQLKQPKTDDLTCIVGIMPALKAGETIRCEGTWRHHLVFGMQFEVAQCSRQEPSDLVGIEKYLASGLVRGIGPAYAKKIVAVFGLSTLQIIDHSPDELLSVDGIGKKRVDLIKTCWEEQKAIRDLMIFLQSYEVSPSLAQKIFRVYGKEARHKIEENPFDLAREIRGIGFKTADQIAMKLGMSQDNPQRIASGIEYVLSKLSEDGHTCYPLTDFLKEAQEILLVDTALIEQQIQGLKEEKRIQVGPLTLEGNLVDFIWIAPLFYSEMGIAREIRRLKSAPSNLRAIDPEKALSWVQSKLAIELAPKQVEAVTAALSQKVLIITGGPGTGKSTITKAILAILEKLTSKMILAAPTGRAAKRMSEITNKKASTLHSLLSWNFKAGGFKRNRENPLDGDLLIIDEASMIDTVLMYSLLKAIPDHCRVIFVGDINQLPSVGPGNVLKDLIDSEKVPVSILHEIFRQAKGSEIITNAHRINQGQFPNISNEAGSDFFFIQQEDPQYVLKEVISLVSQRLPRKFRFNPIQDIQVLAPMKKGIIGTANFNIELQKALNPSKEPPLHIRGVKYLVGDKVMQICNNYEKEVYNGDIGKIQAIDFNEEEAVIDFDDQPVLYKFSELDEIAPAYAVSVHKYQGSECPCVVMPIHMSHFKLLHRNLIYTGVTRGKKLVVLVGSKRALMMAIKNDEVIRRYTGLKSALSSVMERHAFLWD